MEISCVCKKAMLMIMTIAWTATHAANSKKKVAFVMVTCQDRYR